MSGDWMARWVAAFSFGFIALCSAGAAVVDVTVLDPEGQPVQNAVLMCVRGADVRGLTDDAGRFAVPDSCTDVECVSGFFVSGHARLSGEFAICQLSAAVVVRGEVAGPGIEQTWFSATLRTAKGTRAVAEVTVGPLPDDRTPRFRMPPVSPGAYVLEVVREQDMWSCVTDLGALSSGEREVVVSWHEPIRVTGVVLDPEGKPFPKVLLHVEHSGEAAAVGATRCELHMEALDIVSDRDGRFSAPVDLTRTYRIEVDPAWQPAIIRIDGAR